MMQITKLTEILKQIDHNLLPESMVELLEVLGAEDTLNVIAAYPGIRLYVPLTYDKQSPIAQHVGISAYTKLWETYQNGTLDVPKPDSLIKHVKYAQVFALRDEGKAIDTIAVSVGFTARHIGRLLAKRDQPVVAKPKRIDAQQSLF